MRWTVVWLDDAEQELAAIWTPAADQADVTAAADEIDRRLARDPLNEGEARTAPTRILIVPPLAVLYDVSEPDRLVSVWAVWRVS